MTDITGRALPQLTGDEAPCSNLCYCERAANRAEIERLRAEVQSKNDQIGVLYKVCNERDVLKNALQWIADQVDNEDGDLDDIILCANKAISSG